MVGNFVVNRNDKLREYRNKGGQKIAHYDRKFYT
jgi:hypothetical protein